MKDSKISLNKLRMFANNSYKIENFSLSGLIRYLRENKTNKDLKVLLTELKIKQSEISFDLLKSGAMAESFFLFNSEGIAIDLKKFFSFNFALTCLINAVTKKFINPRELEKFFQLQVAEVMKVKNSELEKLEKEKAEKLEKIEKAKKEKAEKLEKEKAEKEKAEKLEKIEKAKKEKLEKIEKAKKEKAENRKAAKKINAVQKNAA